jgi:hypothetical protein
MLHPIDGCLEVMLVDGEFVVAGSNKGSFIAHVGNVRSREAGSKLREARGNIQGGLLRRDLAQVHEKDGLA